MGFLNVLTRKHTLMRLRRLRVQRRPRPFNRKHILPLPLFLRLSFFRSFRNLYRLRLRLRLRLRRLLRLLLRRLFRLLLRRLFRPRRLRQGSSVLC